MVGVGGKYAKTLGAKGNDVSMPWLSIFWMYVPVPIAGVAMIIFEIESLYAHIKSIALKTDYSAGVIDSDDEIEKVLKEAEAEEKAKAIEAGKEEK